MENYIYQASINNIIVASIFAFFAYLLGRSSKHPQLSYLLWFFVIIKLITPPIISLPGIELSKLGISTQQVSAHTAQTLSEGVAHQAINQPPHWLIDSNSSYDFISWLQKIDIISFIISFSLLGSLIILAHSFYKALRFHQLIKSEAHPATAEIKAIADELAQTIGLKKTPLLTLTTASISPMVWWIGGRVHVILPLVIIDQMTPSQWRWVLAHELVHVKRLDHLVRWIEWLAGGLWWWNPLAWYARKQLRIHEERCCDNGVISLLTTTGHHANAPVNLRAHNISQSRDYAESILTVVEKLVSPEHRPPTQTSQINSGGQLELRIKMILNPSRTKKATKRQQVVAIIAATTLLPLSFTYVKAQPQVNSSTSSKTNVSKPHETSSTQQKVTSGDHSDIKSVLKEILIKELTDQEIQERFNKYFATETARKNQRTKQEKKVQADAYFDKNEMLQLSKLIPLHAYQNPESQNCTSCHKQN